MEMAFFMPVRTEAQLRVTIEPLAAQGVHGLIEDLVVVFSLAGTTPDRT
jgi:hypothetical protein